MIARGGGYEGPTALKNTPESPVNRMDSIKKMAFIAPSSGLQLAGCRECSGWKLLLMVCSQGKPGVQTELMQLSFGSLIEYK